MAVFGQWTKGDAQLLINEDEPSPRKGQKPRDVVSHRAAIGKKKENRMVGRVFFAFFFEAPGTFHRSFSTKELFPFCGEDTVSQPSRRVDSGMFFFGIF